ncbi:MAG TPA: tetratricopeptide repeat protein [Terracidiphilus sp.]|jgi:tetratricopeptide (TPR) repeat protein
MASATTAKQSASRKAQLLIAGPFLFWAVAAATQSNPGIASSSLEHDFQAAMAARDGGDLERAKEMLSAIRQKHPGIFPVDESLGLIYVAEQKYADALPLLQTAAHEQADSDVAHANLGADFYKLGRESEARREFEEAARLNPNNAATQQGLGELWLNAGEPKRALEAFRAALKAKRDDADLEMDCATAMVAVGQLDDAKAMLSKLPEAAQTQELLGEIAEKQGDYQRAVVRFSRAIELDPSETNAWTLGVELLRHWSFDPAIREFAAAVAKFPSSTRMKLGLGAAYFGDAKYAEAIPVFAELLQTDENNSLYAEMLGMACNAVTESAKGQCSALLTYARNHRHDARAATYAASMLLTETASGERTATAREFLNTALAADPKLPDAHYQMGILKQNEGDWAGSIGNLEAAIALKPDLAQAHYRLALAYWRTGRKQDGQAQMELQKKYAKQEKEDMASRLRQITTFIVDVRQ